MPRHGCVHSDPGSGGRLRHPPRCRGRTGSRAQRDDAGRRERALSLGAIGKREPEGVEPALLRRWAKQLDARLEWVRGSEAALVEAYGKGR